MQSRSPTYISLFPVQKVDRKLQVKLGRSADIQAFLRQMLKVEDFGGSLIWKDSDRVDGDGPARSRVHSRGIVTHRRSAECHPVSGKTIIRVYSGMPTARYMEAMLGLGWIVLLDLLGSVPVSI